MNLLDIMKLTNTCCGLQGDIDTVDNLKDMQTDLLRFVQQANNNIQLQADDWKFMKGTIQIALTPALNTHEDDTVAKWDRVLNGSTDLRFVDYDKYLISDWTVPGPPHQYTIVPETNQLIINALDNNYTFTIRYTKVPNNLVLNTDKPLFPARFHNLVAYTAATSFGSWLGSSEIEDKNATMADTIMGFMMRSERPAKTMNYSPMA